MCFYRFFMLNSNVELKECKEKKSKIWELQLRLKGWHFHRFRLQILKVFKDKMQFIQLRSLERKFEVNPSFEQLDMHFLPSARKAAKNCQKLSIQWKTLILMQPRITQAIPKLGNQFVQSILIPLSVDKRKQKHT